MNKPLLALSLLLLFPEQASATHSDMSSCFEDAGIRFVAQTADIDVETARQIAPMLPEGRTMLANLRQAAQSAVDARADGVDRDLLILISRGSMADTPALAVLVTACIEIYY